MTSLTKQVPEPRAIGSSSVLTDTDIHQDALWTQATDFIGRVETPSLGGLGPWLDRKSKSNALLLALKLLIHQSDYDAVVTGDLRAGQIVGFLRTVLGTRRPVHVQTEITLDKESDSLLWKLKRGFQRLAFASTDLLVTSARGEVDIYSDRLGIPRERFSFIPFHTNVVNPGPVGEQRGYAFSAGRSGRDYAVLAQAAQRLDLDLVVLGDVHSLEGLTFPDRTKLLVDQPYDRYIELLHGCDFVVVPLTDLPRSTGQVVILEAMAIGKPVIATETVGTVDYIESGETGLLVPPGDAEALATAMDRFHRDSELRARVSERGLEFARRHTFRIYVEALLQRVERTIAYRSGRSAEMKDQTK
ncbi:MAG: glycosyltransferase [Deltaproteobacteria bacterium]|nr:glycosyltransferase [Deltaproteobacteria bacterium]NND28003.1 glycosyltransferase [Myxococcales bacterium]MBT8465515.1 glycosyltransferase [Deltaproteobacteria bacterium]MBT8482473.1 glycosyltransferase [Deltaproteobacteria bacterium]NNK08211.1 glycosyltransferase [Myxococcales bacterium]